MDKKCLKALESSEKKSQLECICTPKKNTCFFHVQKMEFFVSAHTGVIFLKRCICTLSNQQEAKVRLSLIRLKQQLKGKLCEAVTQNDQKKGAK